MTLEKANAEGYRIRWRKGTATWVIYKGQRVVESGFGDEAAALDWLDWWLDDTQHKPHSKPRS